MAKDKQLRPLYRLLGEGNAAKAVETGDHLMGEIEEEISQLRKQLALVREMLAPYRSAISEDGLTSAQRGDRIREVVLTILEAGHAGPDVLVSVEDVLAHLKEHYGELSVKRPASVIGTVMARMQELERISAGKFRPISLSDGAE